MIEATAAVVDTRGGPFEPETVLLDDPRPDEVLVRIRAVGICHTDLSVRAGRTPAPLPAVLGHEGAGTVVAVGAAVTRVRPGDTVILTFDSCGACPPCLGGRPVRCEHWAALNLFGGHRLDGSATLRGTGRRDGAVLHGHFFGQSSFATHALADERNAVAVPGPALPFELLAPFGCGVQTGAGAVFHVLRPRPGDTVVVFGAGAVGLAAVLAARLTPAARIVAVDLRPARLALARELGATDVVDAGADDPVAAVLDLTGGRGADHTLETSGSVRALRQAVDALAVGGTCGVVGAPPAGSEVGLDVPALLARAPRIVGVNQGASVPGRFLPALVDLFRAGRLPVDRLVRAFPFAAIEEAAAAAEAGEAVKPVLTLP
ncbi:NAD(P)-dependent alcohol dehydrogenase [Streptomyces sp. BE20]|uniref:NAD(P)-dependent alcohol dehydrogenase n=1 Tax=Streptomyces sp. BE20 TaxID=3002525 RepID=UPI002E76DD32|nr:NAD(P)-dependent alcohol dehydrogenase [Streptomyces sp. BE20]MEE1823640.1 NAD(P)-dependent alcohol dehydrogenase [Streptomyces sp. BE20]